MNQIDPLDVYPGEQQHILSARMHRIVLAVALLSLFASFASLLFGQKVTRPRSRDRDSFSTSDVGHRAFHDTLRELGFHVLQHRTGRHGDATAPLLFVEPRLTDVLAGGRPIELGEALRERAERGLVTVLVLPKWVPAPKVNPFAKGERVTAVDRSTVVKLLNAAGQTLRDGRGELPLAVRHRLPKSTIHRTTFSGSLGSFRVEAPWLQTFRIGDARGLRVLLGTPEDALIVESPLDGKGRLILVSDPDLLHSYNLHRADHAALWAALLRHELATDSVIIDEIFHGFGEQPSLAGALGTFPLVLVPLHALLLALLGALAGASRFGPPRRARPALGSGPREVIGVAASVFAAGRPAAQLAAAYVRRVLGHVAAKTGFAGAGRAGSVPVEASQAAAILERDRRLDDLAERKGQLRQAEELTRQAEEYENAGHRREQDALRLAQRAWAFRTALLMVEKRENRR